MYKLIYRNTIQPNINNLFSKTSSYDKTIGSYDKHDSFYLTDKNIPREES